MITRQLESHNSKNSLLSKQILSLERFTCCLAVALLGTLLSSCANISPKPPVPPPGAPSVADIIKSVQTAIDSFYPQAGVDSSLPPLKNVKLSLQTVLDNKATGEADYLLVALKGYNENVQTQELDVILTPEQTKMTTMSLNEPPSIAVVLQQAIKKAQEQIQRTYTSTVHGRSLNTTEVDVQIGFTVTWDAAIGVNKWELLPITLSGGEEISHKTTHTITVAFAKPDK